jgi:CRISPR-associated protein Cst1
MKTTINYYGYDTLLQPTDWRAAAAVVGLCKYFDHFRIDYKILYNVDEKPENYIHGFDGIIYKSDSITEEKYLDFVESYFEKYMTHIKLQNILNKDKLIDEDIVNFKRICTDSFYEKFFENKRFDGSNKDYFISAIYEKRYEMITHLYKYKLNLYGNYCNKNRLYTDKNKVCRIKGYDVDNSKKTNILGFCFSKESFDANDILEFDFIPFAFSNPDMRETYFVNNNFSVETLVNTNRAFSEQLSNTEGKGDKNKLLLVLQNSKDYISYDVEIISKSQSKDYYETFFVRLVRLKLLRNLSEKMLNYYYSTNNYTLTLQSEVYYRCLNNVLLDDVILRMLKLYFIDTNNRRKIRANTDVLIQINVSWKGIVNMDKLYSAKKCGNKVSQKLISLNSENTIISYRHKLTSSLCVHDYDRVKDILLKLYDCVGIDFPFMYDFFENAEENKDVVYMFVSGLYVSSERNNENKD